MSQYYCVGHCLATWIAHMMSRGLILGFELLETITQLQDTSATEPLSTVCVSMNLQIYAALCILGLPYVTMIMPILTVWLSCDCRVTVVWLSCDYQVTIRWLSCDYHVTVVWLSCDYRVTVVWPKLSSHSCSLCVSSYAVPWYGAAPRWNRNSKIHHWYAKVFRQGQTPSEVHYGIPKFQRILS